MAVAYVPAKPEDLVKKKIYKVGVSEPDWTMQVDRIQEVEEETPRGRKIKRTYVLGRDENDKPIQEKWMTNWFYYKMPWHAYKWDRKIKNHEKKKDSENQD